MTAARSSHLANSASRFRQQRLLVAICLISMSGVPACAQTQDSSLADALALLRQADSLLAQANYEQAASKAAEAAKAAKGSAMILQRAAETLYLSGHSAESLPLFDRVIELVPDQAPQNWQRGIALCSCGKFEEGAKQFKTHHDVNPDDVENSAWYFLCIAKTKDLAAARETVIPSRGDGRQPMMSVLQMLQGKLQPEDVLQAAIDNTSPGPARQRAQFYAALYVGLYYDALGDAAQAATYLKKSLTYGSSGYMADTARVYLADRLEQTSDSESGSSK
jgi:lipoprotein NlpI